MALVVSGWALLVALALALAVGAGCKRSEKPPETAAATNAEVVQINARLETIRKTGLPVTLEGLNRWLPMPPPSQNATPRWTNAFAALVPIPTNAPGLPARSLPFSTEAKGVLQGILATNQTALARLHDAATNGQARFTLDWTRGLRTDLPHLAGAKQAAMILQLEATVRAEDNQLDSAVASLQAMAALAKALELEPALVEQFVRAGILTYACKAAERIVNRNTLSDAQLARLQEMFHAAQRPEALTCALVGERCQGLHLFQLPREQLAWLLSVTATGPSPSVSSNQVTAMADTFARERNADCLFFLDQMQGLITASAGPYPKFAEAARTVAAQVEEQQRQPMDKRLVVSTLILPAYTNAPARFARNTALLRAAETAMAIERHRLAHGGQLPPDLAALTPAYLHAVPVDPFDEQPLRLKPLTKGYVVYSIGSDARDDGGKERGNGLPNDPTGDETFTVER